MKDLRDMKNIQNYLYPEDQRSLEFDYGLGVSRYLGGVLLGVNRDEQQYIEERKLQDEKGLCECRFDAINGEYQVMKGIITVVVGEV